MKWLSITWIFATLGVASYGLFSNWTHFVTLCPALDVLSWDANLRLITVIDQYRDFGNGDIVGGVRPFLESPTWPALRSFFSLLLFAFTGPDAVWDVSIGFAFFCLLLLSCLYVSIRLSESPLEGAAIFFFCVAALFHTREIPAYSLSSMLETQGMFFLLWSAYWIFRCYEGRGRGVWLLLSVQGLFHTKYPYGVMLLLAVAAYEALSRPGAWREFGMFGFREHYRGVRRVAIVVFGLLLLALLFARKFTPIDPNTKVFKYLFYLVALILFADFNVFVVRHREALRGIVPASMRMLYPTAFLPALAWLFLHPDRLISVLGTQLHVQEQTRSFALSFFTDVFDIGWPIVVLSLAAFFAGGFFFYKNRSGGGISQEDRGRMAASLIVVLQFLILEFLTGNKQLRHIYHLLPALLVLCLLWVFHLSRLLPKRSHLSAFFPAAIFLMGVFLFVRPGGLLTSAYASARPLCYTGTDGSVYEPARWMSSRIDPEARHILINSFHRTLEPSRGRMLATETDLLLRMAVGDGDVRNDSRYRHRTWEGFDRLLFVTATCPDPLRDPLLEQRAGETGSRIELRATHRHPSGDFCLRDYGILHPGE